MRYSIITPTLARPTLRRLCDSIDAQTAANSWEHLIAVDMPLVFDKVRASIIESIPKDPRRRIFRCGKNHNNYGNTCRWKMWEYATGDYILYADDDNYLADPLALERLDSITADWALFPMLRHGERFFHDPPTFSKLDTGNLLIKREHGRWPDIPGGLTPGRTISLGYSADWSLAERLMQSHAYQALPDLQPVVVMDETNWGKK